MNASLFQWLNNRGIRDKLLIYIAIPLIVILFFSLLGIFEKHQQYVNSKNTQNFLSIVIQLDELIHELQKERGISSGIQNIQSNDSKNAITVQRIVTDQSLQTYLRHKKQTNIDFLSKEMRDQFLNLGDISRSLFAIRARVDKSDLSNVIADYSEINLQLINFVQYLELLANKDELTQLSNAYINLIWLQERAGQERASLVKILSSKYMHADYFRQMLSHIESQETLIRNYEVKAPLKHRLLLQKKMSHSANSEVEHYRDAIVNKIVRQEFLNELQALIGYGGIIHDFKNYILRGESTYLQNFQLKKKEVHNLINRYNLSTNLTQEDILQLNVIESVMNNYFQFAEKVSVYLQQGISIQEIDKRVKVDDTAALQAINYLRKDHAQMNPLIWWDTASTRINSIKEVNDQVRLDIQKHVAEDTQSAITLLWIYVAITVIALLISIAIGFFIMKRLIGELKNISNDMEIMLHENKFDKPLIVNGKDEISVMAEAFNKLIGERIKFETALALSAEVFENTKEAIMISDANKQIQMVNPAFKEVSGFTEESILGKDFFCLSENPVDDVTFDQIWDQLLHTSHWEGELWNKKPNGESYLIWLRINIVKDKEGVISQYIGMFVDITQRKQQEEHIWRQANYDSLTDLPNRNMCMDRLSQSLMSATRLNTQVAVLFIDLDRFKIINDTLGHSAGDELLIEVAIRLKNSIRESDIVSRLGGDEFVILLNNITDIYTIEKIAGNILIELSKPVPLSNQSETYTSGSIGIALFPQDGGDAETLMKHADTAMYQSKRLGRNNFMFYKQEMNKAAMQHMKIDKELRQAIVNEQFCLYYQPVIDLASGHILGAEALIRWNHPTQGLVGPDKFIRVAEDSDLIIPIGEWVIASAAHQAAKWNKISKQVFKVAINISSRQCSDNGKSIVKTLAKTVKEEQLEPGMLEIEITESLLMGGEVETINALQKIRDIGIGISLDDFGTGYSSLSYLKHFPISTIKIDRSFIRDVTTDKKDAQLVNAILMMGKGLDIDVIGEGIEKPEHLAFLKQFGCKAGQGYYFSRPLPADEFEAYLLQQGAISDYSVTEI